jgi:hypothetical protein
MDCGGIFIAHLDGTAAACTEELLGRPCRGDHHEATATCEDVLGPGGCEFCDVVFTAERWIAQVAASERSGVQLAATGGADDNIGAVGRPPRLRAGGSAERTPLAD